MGVEGFTVSPATVSISGVRHQKNPPTEKDFLRENETSISDSVRDLRENNQYETAL